MTDIATTTMITLETDTGCPIGGNDLVAYPEGILPALKRLALTLDWQDPRRD